MSDEKALEALPIVGKQPESEREEKYLREICEFEFYNSEEPGLMHKFVYGNAKHKKVFQFVHGGKYRIPRHVARHIENCTTPLYDWRPNGLGQMEKKRVGNKQRFQMRHVFA